MKYKLVRDVTQKECDWLDRNYKKDEIVYEYPECTYGCISHNGVACIEKPYSNIEHEPFFELPINALRKIK
jgi:hypothetical protein